MKRSILYSGLLISVIFISGCHCNCYNGSYSHQFSQGYNTLYPPRDELFYREIQKADSSSEDTVSFLFYFVNTFREFYQYEFQQDGGNTVCSDKGEFVVKFNKKAAEDTYSFLKIKVVLKNKEVNTFEMQMSFDPGIAQERSGRKGARDGLFVRKSDVGFLGIMPEDFIPPPPPEDEMEFLRDQFSDQVKNSSTEKEKIKTLAKEIIDLLEPFRGIPSNAMDTLSAVKQLMKLKQSNERVYCGNIADIFLTACLSFDIPARKVGLGNTYDDASDPMIFHSDYHTAVEVFDKEEGAWHLVDLSFYLLEVKMENGRILNFVDFLYLLNSPDAQKEMIVSEYDVKEQKVKEIKISEARNLSRFMDYYKRNQKFVVPHRSGYFSFYP